MDNSYYTKLLLEEAKTLKIYDPFNSRPKNSYDEIFENCFLGDGYKKIFMLHLKLNFKIMKILCII